jgi:photosystem II stability/assembly factor-like uncharacterized protein
MTIDRDAKTPGNAPGATGMSAAGRFLAGFLLVCLGAAARAALPTAGGKVEVILHGTAHDALYDIAFEGRKGIAVGAFGTVLTTGDGGATWAAQSPAPTGLALFGVAVRDGRCVIVGQTGIAFAADDCKQWKLSPPVTKARLSSVSLNRNGHACAVGSFGTILSSSDWGKTWTQLPMDWSGISGQSAEPHLYGVHVGDDGTLTVVGEFELILRSTDGGGQWKVLHKGERSLFGLQVLDNGQAYAVGQSGAVLASSDRGATWRSLDTGVTAILTGVLATPTGEVVASGINTIVYSEDGGASWSSLQSRLVNNAWHEALAASEDSSGKRRVMSVGAGGSILQLTQ